MEAASEIGKDGGGLVIGMSGDVENARGDASGVDGFDGFGADRGRCREQQEIALWNMRQ